MKHQYKDLTDAKLISLLFEELYKTDLMIQCRLEELEEQNADNLIALAEER